MKPSIILSALLMLVVSSQSANAVQVIQGKVTTIEPTYMPAAVTFMLDTGNATCPAGTFLKWQKDAENNKILYSTLLTAMLSGRQVKFHMNPGDTSCTGQYLHLL